MNKILVSLSVATLSVPLSTIVLDNQIINHTILSTKNQKNDSGNLMTGEPTTFKGKGAALTVTVDPAKPIDE